MGVTSRYGLLKKKDGTLLQNPPEDHVLEDGDRVVALSRSGACGECRNRKFHKSSNYQKYNLDGDIFRISCECFVPATVVYESLARSAFQNKRVVRMFVLAACLALGTTSEQHSVRPRVMA